MQNAPASSDFVRAPFDKDIQTMTPAKIAMCESLTHWMRDAEKVELALIGRLITHAQYEARMRELTAQFEAISATYRDTVAAPEPFGKDE
jgi:hypothetical protein